MASYSNTPGLVDMPCVSTKKSFDNISLVRFLFLLVFISLSLVCGIVYMFVCKLYALLCWRKIKYLSIYLSTKNTVDGVRYIYSTFNEQNIPGSINRV